MTSAVRLNSEQEVAVQALLDFIADPEPPSPFFVLGGSAGTGKTFCMREVLARCSRSRAKFAFTAPTNKAAKVLRAIVGEACTIFSLLGLRIEKNGEVKTLETGKPAIDLTDIDVIFIDEGGMVNRHLCNLLTQEAAAYRLKVVFMGDPCQLPPVGEEASPIWAFEQGAFLTRVMRHDNQILKLVTAIRVSVGVFNPSIIIKSDNNGEEGVWKFTARGFKEAIYSAAQKGAFSDTAKGKVIAWRNVRVGEYNDIIRSAIFGAAAVSGFYLLGDRLIATAPCKRGEDVLLATDDEAIVEGALETKHPFDQRYEAIELKCRTEMNALVRILVLHPRSQLDFDNDSAALAHAAKANPKLWRKFWEHKELFHEVKYAYAITAHRSQGSTYETVFVDYQDILYNRNRKEAFQCLYVACSRPTKALILA